MRRTWIHIQIWTYKLLNTLKSYKVNLITAINSSALIFMTFIYFLSINNRLPAILWRLQRPPYNNGVWPRRDRKARMPIGHKTTGGVCVCVRLANLCKSIWKTRTHTFAPCSSAGVPKREGTPNTHNVDGLKLNCNEYTYLLFAVAQIPKDYMAKGMHYLLYGR